MAAKKIAAQPVAVQPAARQPLSKIWTTSDDALTLILSAKGREFEITLEDEEEGGSSIQLAIDFGQIDEFIKLLTEARNVAIRYMKGENIPSDPVDEIEDDGPGDDDEEEEDDELNGEEDELDEDEEEEDEEEDD